MAEGILRRLGAVARDLNVGKGTIVDFLKDNGYADVNPNSKLDQKMYGILVDEFAADRKLKMEAEAKTEVLQQRKDERMAASEDQQEVKEEVISAQASKVDGPKVLGSMNLDDLTPAARKKKLEEVKAQEAKEAAEKAKAEKEAAKKAAAPSVKTKEQEDKEVIKAEASKEDGPKVLGSINLDDLTPAARKKKQEEAKAKKAQEAKETAEQAQVAKEAADKAAAEASKKAEADNEENQVIKASVEKLAGAKVLGKMELPVEKPRAKKPVATSNDSADKKRKRKRVRRPADGATTPGAANRPRGTGAGAAAAAGRGGARAKRVPLTDEEIQKQIKETLARLSGNKTKSKGAKYRREKRQAIAERTEAQEEQSELLVL